MQAGSGYELLQFYMKCEKYLNLDLKRCWDVDELIKELVRSDAVTWGYAWDSKESLEDHIRKSKDELFKIITVEYFSRFKKSKRYRELKESCIGKRFILGDVLLLD